MSLLCRLGGHTPIPSQIWNCGYYFSRCSVCDCEMIGRGGRWRAVPRGLQVVWRPRTENDSEWTPWAPGKTEPGRLSEMLEGIPIAKTTADSVLESFNDNPPPRQEGIRCQL